MIEAACWALVALQSARVEWVSGPDVCRAGDRGVAVRVRLTNTGDDALPSATVEEYYGVKKTTAQINVGLDAEPEAGAPLVPLAGRLVTVPLRPGESMEVDLAFDVPAEASGPLTIRVQAVVVQQVPEVKVWPISDEVRRPLRVEGMSFWERPTSLLALLGLLQAGLLLAAGLFVVRGVRRRRGAAAAQGAAVERSGVDG